MGQRSCRAARTNVPPLLLLPALLGRRNRLEGKNRGGDGVVVVNVGDKGGSFDAYTKDFSGDEAVPAVVVGRVGGGGGGGKATTVGCFRGGGGGTERRTAGGGGGTGNERNDGGGGGKVVVVLRGKAGTVPRGLSEVVPKVVLLPLVVVVVVVLVQASRTLPENTLTADCN
jgi:hypothetical protein